MRKGILIGAGAAAAALVLGAYAFVALGLMPANADAPPPRLEAWAARKSLRASIARESKGLVPPMPADDANLTAGAKVYAAECAFCHGASDGEPSAAARGLYQRAPQFAKHGVDDDPEGETYWKVFHGIRMTGMPSYRGALSETQMWQVSLFLKHLPELTPGARKAWRSIPSQAVKP